MNQKAITAVAVLDEMIKERPLHSDQDTLNEAKSRIQELDLQSNNGWIPVTKRLPENDGIYQIWRDDDAEILEYDTFLNGKWYNYNPTHWIDIPN